MCICINCLYVHKCATYEIVTTQHIGVNNKGRLKKLFSPCNPIIHVNFIYTSEHTKSDWDIVECSSFMEEPGNWIYDSDRIDVN
jgi:hypothetical protein